MIIGVDVDGVLAHYNDELAFIVEREKGLVPGTLKPPVGWNFPDWDLDDKGFKHYHKMMMLERMLNMQAYGCAGDVLHRLSQKHIIRIITQRASGYLNGPIMKNDIACNTIIWLGLKDIPFHEISFVEDKTTVDFDLIVEDSPLHLQTFIDKGRGYIIMDHLYNRHIPGVRLGSWLAIEEYIEGLSE